jgi:hypothetical protein
MHGEGSLSHAGFEEKVRRLCREELDPRRLQLVRRELPGGKMRFIIKSAATGTICETIEYEPPARADGAPENLDRRNFAAARLARAAV